MDDSCLRYLSLGIDFHISEFPKNKKRNFCFIYFNFCIKYPVTIIMLLTLLYNFRQYFTIKMSEKKPKTTPKNNPNLATFEKPSETAEITLN
jgi:hypothetical protein